jgi:Rrf2 family transcriptional regulator, iron-sulfur cluster assembly transcription factor
LLFWEDKIVVMFSKACEYAIRSMVFIASKSLQGERVEIKEVAANSGSPLAFTAKILQILTKAELIKSYKGHGGGFEMDTDKLKSVTVQHIVDVIDGNSSYTRCFMGLSKCSETQPCPLHAQYKKIRNDFADLLKESTIEDLVIGINSGKTFLSV